MNKFIAYAALALLFALPGAAMAQTADAPVPDHPRVNEVDQRLQDQQNRVNNGVADGQINAGQAAHDDSRDAHVSQELNKDQAKDGGHITKAEQRKMNRQLNKNSKHIHHQRKKPATTTPAAQ